MKFYFIFKKEKKTKLVIRDDVSSTIINLSPSPVVAIVGLPRGAKFSTKRRAYPHKKEISVFGLWVFKSFGILSAMENILP